MKVCSSHLAGVKTVKVPSEVELVEFVEFVELGSSGSVSWDGVQAATCQTGACECPGPLPGKNTLAAKHHVS